MVVLLSQPRREGLWSKLASPQTVKCMVEGLGLRVFEFAALCMEPSMCHGGHAKPEDTITSSWAEAKIPSTISRPETIHAYCQP